MITFFIGNFFWAPAPFCPNSLTYGTRIAQLSDVPVIADTVRGYESTTWVSAFAPAGTPKAIIERLNAELGKAMRDPDVAAKLSAQTLDPTHRAPEELAQHA